MVLINKFHVDRSIDLSIYFYVSTHIHINNNTIYYNNDHTAHCPQQLHLATE